MLERYTLEEIAYRTGGPARYVRVEETGGRLGFITPLTHNFCESCNRVRLTCTGTLYMCLGQEDAADLRAPLRASEGDELLDAAIDEAISRKPKGHDFVIDRAPAARRRPPHERDRRARCFLPASNSGTRTRETLGRGSPVSNIYDVIVVGVGGMGSATSTSLPSAVCACSGWSGSTSAMPWCSSRRA